MKAEVRNPKSEVAPVSRAASAALLLSWLLCAVVAGCTVGPDYKRPAVNTPAAYRTAAIGHQRAFCLPTHLRTWAGGMPTMIRNLKAYLAEALTNSWDIKIAAARVLQAEAAARVARSQFFPTVNAGGDLLTTFELPNGVRTPSQGTIGIRMYSDASLGLWPPTSWTCEVASAARTKRPAPGFSPPKPRNGTVRQTLVAQVATAYLTLLELDLELAIARGSYASRVKSPESHVAREEGGVSSMQDVVSIKNSRRHGRGFHREHPSRQIEQTENELNILLGRNPGTIAARHSAG